MASGFFKIGKVQAAIDELGIVEKYRDKCQKALAQITLVMVRDTEPFVPWDTGATAKSAIIESDFSKGQIRYNTPYAENIYYGDDYNFSTDAHPQATSRWFDVAKRRYYKDWVDKTAKFIGGEASK